MDSCLRRGDRGISQFINAMTGSVGFLLMMYGHERDMRYVTVVSGTSAIF